MLAKFKPTWLVSNVYNLTPDQFKRQGIQTVLSDLDNTLVPWNHATGTDQLAKWNQRLRRDKIKLIVVSNNTHWRVSKALAGLNLTFVSWSMKPLSWGINRALDRYHLARTRVVMIGDQLLTDIWAANNSHVRSILVKPLVKTDSWNTRINRFFERKIRKRLKRKYQFLHWQKDLNYEK